MLLALALLLTAAPVPKEVFAAGNGSEFLQDVEQVDEVPAEYVGIYNDDDLKAIENNPSGKYILMNDIELSGAFTPLCRGGFAGVLEGNGYTISGLSISATVLQGQEYAIGLFAQLEGEICNLMVQGQIDIQMGPKEWISKGSCFVGDFAGIAVKGAKLDNCVADVDINVEQEMVGVFEFEGFAGFIGAHMAGGGYPSRIDFCRNLGDIKGNANTAGIIYEYSAGGTILSITYCVNEGAVEGNYDVGGIMGRSHGEGYIIGCVNKGMITAGDNAAGITAYDGPYMELTDCLNMGTIMATENRGSASGIADVNDFRRLERCINVGELRSVGQGAISTVNSGGIFDCYYLTGTLYSNEGGRYPADCTDTTGLLTEKEMADQSSFVNFDFQSKWTMDNNLRHPYPTKLMKDGQLKNLYKFQYIADHNHSVDSSMQYLEIMTNSGQGSMAGMISELYSNDKTLALGNQAWEGINELSDLLSWEVELGNDFDLVLADLMSRMVSVDAYESMLNDEVLAAFSDVVTGLSSTVDLADVEMKAELEGLLT